MNGQFADLLERPPSQCRDNFNASDGCHDLHVASYEGVSDDSQSNEYVNFSWQILVKWQSRAPSNVQLMTHYLSTSPADCSTCWDFFDVLQSTNES